MLTNRAEQRPEGSIPPLLYKAQGSITFTHVNSPFSAFESLTDDNFETVLGEAGSGTCNADPNATDLYDEDGTTGIARKVFARHAYKLNLHYYDGDYSPINMLGYTTASGLANNERYDLYNGNISSMAVNIRKLATVANSPGAAYAGAMLYNYRYDQLNRLMEVDAHATNGSFGLVSAAPHTPLPDYKERYSYDPNGNIKSLFRNGTSGTYAGHATPNVAMDDLTYKYQYATTTPGVMGEYTPGQADPTDLGYYTNRLASVQDPTNLTGNYTEDIDNQAALNYTYDAIGNLIHDEKGDIDIIDWTVYGKIERIVKKDGSKIEYTYDASGNRISKAVIPPTGGGGAITWYVRDAQGNVMSTYVAGDNSLNSGALTQTELHVYGSSRIGVLNLSLNCSGSGLSMASTRTLTRGQKFFELTNHLGNVLATVTDRLVPMPNGNSTMVDYYLADVATATDYYAFGMQMPGRGYSSGAYRYGFNGKENDNEVGGTGNQISFEARTYDPRLAKFLSIDPMTTKYAWQSPFAYNRNSPITYVDWLGLGDKYFDESGKFLYETKDKKTGVFLIAQESFAALMCGLGNDLDKLSNELSKNRIVAFQTEEAAAKAWAPSGFDATKNDPNTFERAAQIFHARTTGDASVPDLYVLGNTVVGQNSKETGVKQEVNPANSMLLVNGKNMSEFKYKKMEPHTYDKYQGDEVTWRMRIGIEKNPKVVGYHAEFYTYWNVSAMIHTHQPGNEEFSLNSNQFGAYTGDASFAFEGKSVYLVPTTASKLSYMYKLDPTNFKYAGFRDRSDAREFILKETKRVPIP